MSVLVGKCGDLMQNEFKADLAYSLSPEHDQIWTSAYKNAFPTFVERLPVSDLKLQKRGVDATLVMRGGKTVLVDEKIRRSVYSDILLEYWSNEEKRVPGWIAKDQLCDYLAYAFEPTRRCYILPFLQLRKCWWDNRHSWVKEHRVIHAQNPGYTTVCVAIPTKVLLNNVLRSMVVDF